MNQQEMCLHYAGLIGQKVQFVTDRIYSETHGIYEWKKGQLSYVDGVTRNRSSFNVVFSGEEPDDLVELPIEQVSQHVQFI